MITILGVHKKSNYKLIPGLDLWDAERDAYNYTGINPVIAHPPCAQWSRMKNFAKSSSSEKELAAFCFEMVLNNGGIFEHPAGSSFFKYYGVDKYKILSVSQRWWGFPAEKRTYLYFSRCKPLATPISFDCATKKVCELHSSSRSIMPLSFCQYLVNCVNQIKQYDT